jgi:hypothetical protein
MRESVRGGRAEEREERWEEWGQEGKYPSRSLICLFYLGIGIIALGVFPGLYQFQSCYPSLYLSRTSKEGPEGVGGEVEGELCGRENVRE